MTGKETIETIISDIKKTQSQGVNNLDTQSVINYLESYLADEGYSHDFQLETLKANHQINLEVLKTNLTSQIEMFKSVITVGANAAKAILIINGGAAISLLAFLGNIWEKASKPDAVSQIALALIVFCAGVLCSGLCSGFTYAAQFSYANNPMNEKTKWHTTGHVANAFAVLFGFASLCCFGIGAYIAFQSMGTQFQNV